jgi:hypothetical protein
MIRWIVQFSAWDITKCWLYFRRDPAEVGRAFSVYIYIVPVCRKKVRVRFLLNHVPFESCWQLPVLFSGLYCVPLRDSWPVIEMCCGCTPYAWVNSRTLQWCFFFGLLVFFKWVSVLLGRSKWIIRTSSSILWCCFVSVPGILGSFWMCAHVKFCTLPTLRSFSRSVGVVRNKIPSVMHLTELTVTGVKFEFLWKIDCARNVTLRLQYKFQMTENKMQYLD